METSILVAIVGGILTLINTVLGMALASMMKSAADTHQALAQHESEIRVAVTRLDHLTTIVNDHTETDRQQFAEIKDQQDEHHKDNQQILHDNQDLMRHIKETLQAWEPRGDRAHSLKSNFTPTHKEDRR